jgi:integrase
MDTNDRLAALPDELANQLGDPLAANELGAALRQVQGHGPQHEVRVVLWAWLHEPSLEPSTIARLGELVVRFASRLEITGVASLRSATLTDCEGFVWAPTRRRQPPSIFTVHLRRTAVRTLYRSLTRLWGEDVVDPSRHLRLPPKTRRVARPLEDDEVMLLRTAVLARSRDRTRAAAVVALAETTATTREISAMRWHDVDLDRHSCLLPGAHPIQPRRATLTGWAAAALTRHRDFAGNPGGEQPVVHRGSSPPGSHAGQAAMSNLLRQLLDAAGLNDDDIKPASVRLWAPARALADGTRVEAVALMLGLTSLDATADLLSYRWRQA